MATVVFGVVLDPDGNPVANAAVAFARAPVDVPDIAALTDQDGRFALSAPAAGQYVVGCRAEGYAPAAVAVHVAGGEPVQMEISLQ